MDSQLRSGRPGERTHCPYCALQCGILLTPGDQGLELSGDESFPVNRGRLCVKGWTAAQVLGHPDRLTRPQVRNSRGELREASWDEALERLSSGIAATRRAHGANAVGVFGSGALTNEKAYLLGKFARVALGTANVDYNGRFCMASAAAASLRAFGLDRGLPFPIEDLAHTELLLLAGANVAETMPPLMEYVERLRLGGGRLIVVDPRATPTAQRASLHLRAVPGTDAAVANGLLHVLVREGLVDADYIARRTEGFEAVRATVASYWPERVERITGVPEALLVEAALLLGRARSAIILTGRGPEQQSQGVGNTLSFINLALARGLVGRPGSGYGCLTGQGNGQGGREHGQKCDQLPGYRRIDDPEARRHVAAVWGVPVERLPGPGKSAYEMLAAAGDPGGIRALLVIGSNLAVSMPNAREVERRLGRLDFLAVADFFLSETARLADVVLPSAQWAEEEGTITNLEGRVLLRRRATAPPEGVRTDIEILCALAERLGFQESFAFAGPRDVFEELRRASQGGPADYFGITWKKIAASQGIFWPCPREDHPGTPRLFTERFYTPSGRARFHPVHHQPAAEEPDAEYPLFLTTGRVLGQYQSGNQTRRVPELARLAPRALAQIHPATARRFGVAPGDTVRLSTRRGTARFAVELTAAIREDSVFVPFHWSGEQAINRLTNPALDPISRMPEFKVCAVRLERSEQRSKEE